MKQSLSQHLGLVFLPPAVDGHGGGLPFNENERRYAIMAGSLIESDL